MITCLGVLIVAAAALCTFVMSMRAETPHDLRIMAAFIGGVVGAIGVFIMLIGSYPVLLTAVLTIGVSK